MTLEGEHERKSLKDVRERVLGWKYDRHAVAEGFVHIVVENLKGNPARKSKSIWDYNITKDTK